MKILIFGSCVSRDPFGHSGDLAHEFLLVDYFARTSLGSQSGKAFEGIGGLGKIQSPFQRRMVERDLGKSFFSALGVLDYDFILIDFVDDRIPLLRSPSDERLTNSSEFKSACLDLSGFSLIQVPEFSDDAFLLWSEGWNNLLKNLESAGCKHKLVVNKVFFAQCDDKGVVFENLAYIERANDYLQRIYDEIVKTSPFCRFVDYDKVEFVARSDHAWGRAPFHFTKEVEDCCLQFLRRLKN